MTKTTIELHRVKDTTANVGHWGIPFSQDSQNTLDAIIGWTRRRGNAGKRVYRHIIFSKDENVRKDPHQWEDSNCPSITYQYKSDYVTYLDIYWQ